MPFKMGGGGNPRPSFMSRDHSNFCRHLLSALPFFSDRRQGTMSFLQLAHKSLKAPAVNPVARLYRRVNK